MGYGSVYQGGYVYSIDDTPAAAASAGGVVFEMTNATSSPAVWSAALTTTNASSTTNGQSNTTAIINVLGSTAASAAETCAQVTDGDVTSWYLPAIQELVGGTQSAFPTLGAVGLLTDTENAEFWSSTEDAANTIQEVDGVLVLSSPATATETDGYFKGSSLSLRCAHAF
ncbi:hypothetical protein D7S86_01375 [Pararobbsia silviterrae]|uniref:DUF1566 domain-containing protein n=1 Tax=Pararobbsia silviterrae TaxID=1792498 RepID=A0A494Y7D7_9BURK|nr:hypothetical protein D7S86_01375 [Pararobbsia silviterrae]